MGKGDIGWTLWKGINNFLQQKQEGYEANEFAKRSR